MHSPLLGPSAWRPLDDVARARGFGVVRPDLTGVADAAWPRWCSLVDTAVESTSGRADLVVVGHSGAGAFLPAIGHRLKDRLRAVVFVDAILPPVAGEHRTSEQFLRFLDDKTVDGRLLPWLDWWPTEVVGELVRSSEELEELRSDVPRLRRSFYDAPIPMPDDWSSGPCAYLQLSPAYSEESRMADHLGWPTSALDGSHLSIFTDPSVVLAAVEDLLDRVELTRSPDVVGDARPKDYGVPE
ncbi:MAG: alpha/beta hydrolase [Ilumatobacteraceae bacterium]